MERVTPRRVLVVANRTAATPQLLDEVERRASEQPTRFALLVPDVRSRRHADWTLERAGALLERSAGAPVERLRGGSDPLQSIRTALDRGRYDEVLISTLPSRRSEWLRRDLPRRAERFGVPVTVVTQRGVDRGGTVTVTSRLP